MDFKILFPDNRNSAETDLRNAQLVMLRILKIVDHICTLHKIEYWLMAGTLLGAVRHNGFIPWDDDLDISMPRDSYYKFLQIAQHELPEDLYLQTLQTEKIPQYAMLCKVRDNNSIMVEVGREHVEDQKGIFIDIFPIDRFKKGFPSFHLDYLKKKLFCSLSSFHHAKYVTNDRSPKNIVKYIMVKFKRIINSEKVMKNYVNYLDRKIKKNLKINTNYILGYGFETPWLIFHEKDDIFPLRRINFEDGSFLAPNNYHTILSALYGNYMQLPPEEKRISHHIAKLVVDTRTAF